MEQSAQQGIWVKALGVLQLAGRRVAQEAFKVWFVACDTRTPPQVRALLFAALAYLGLPLDAIPDLAPVIGFSDDLAALAAALVAANAYVTEEVDARAAAAANRLFS